MILGSPRPQALPSSFLPCLHRRLQYVRKLHQQVSASHIPPPTPFVPDSKTFLTLIGRSLTQHAAKIPTWESLFSLTSAQLRELGVEPARSRRYLLWWRDRFRKGIHGIGGDLQNVVDGIAEVRVVEVPKNRSSGSPTATVTTFPRKRKVIVNLPPGITNVELAAEEAKPVSGMKVLGAHTIVGPYVELVKGMNGSVGRIRVKEGIWEERRGHKVDGGERRKAEVRAKRRAEERRTTRG
ncbi:hypothetical protein MMC08_001301 [Hypocenomyce scalaris]|nr:hypothetical protein [Hypocenomyce scalaris]